MTCLAILGECDGADLLAVVCLVKCGCALVAYTVPHLDRTIPATGYVQVAIRGVVHLHRNMYKAMHALYIVL